jgi:hypothetical protein
MWTGRKGFRMWTGRKGIRMWTGRKRIRIRLMRGNDISILNLGYTERDLAN